MFQKIALVAVVLSLSTAAHADFTPGVDGLTYGTGIYSHDGQFWDGADLPQAHDPTGTTYNVYTGVATAAGGLGLLEPSAPPIRDDIVNYDGIPEQINEYVTAAGGIRRVVNEATTPLGGDVYQIVITVLGSTPDGNPGDLWPAGFNLAGTPATSGAFAIGLGLPASLGGADPLTWQPSPTAVTLASVRVSTNGTFAAPIPIPPTFFAPSAADWNGVLVLTFPNGATGTGVQDAIELTLTVGKLPEPGSLAMLGLGAAAAIRRRRRTA
jgi:hypothetical protein